jgi:hypothetical protein
VDENKLLLRYITKAFSVNYLQYLYFNWEKIVYEEEKTLFNRLTNRKTEYKYWDLKNYDYSLEDNSNRIYDGGKYLLTIISKNDYSSYVHYKRKSVTFFDTLAKLASLFQTFYTTAFYIYKYYAKNFNNYKIIEEVLQINTKSFKQYELRNILYKQNNIPAKEFIKIKDKSEYKLIDDDSEDSKTEEVNDYPRKNTLIKKDSEANDELEEFLQIKIMPKFSFIRFFCNNLYFQNCCYKYRKQEFLHICDEILLKYMSFESILYYQMVLENMLKDYKWNQPILYNIETNELLDKLKNI